MGAGYACPLRVKLPKGIGMRKVRAPQGRITDNVRRRKLPGKCNRNRLPESLWLPELPVGSERSSDLLVQMERRGKSSPAWQATACKCKPYPEQHRIVLYGGFPPYTVGPAARRRWLEACRQRSSQIDNGQGRFRSSPTEPGLQTYHASLQTRACPLGGSFLFVHELVGICSQYD